MLVSRAAIYVSGAQNSGEWRMREKNKTVGCVGPLRVLHEMGSANFMRVPLARALPPSATITELGSSSLPQIAPLLRITSSLLTAGSAPSPDNQMAEQA